MDQGRAYPTILACLGSRPFLLVWRSDAKQRQNRTLDPLKVAVADVRTAKGRPVLFVTGEYVEAPTV